MTWDQAIDDVRNRRECPRAEKLRLFGWRPKERIPPDGRTRAGHPMHDPLLDGT